MTRASRICLVVILAACLLAVDAGPAGRVAPAQAECLKIWKQKKVTRWVKRQGKWRKVTFFKRYQVCDPFQAAGPPRLGVVAQEWKFGLSRPEVKAGNLILEFYNRGEDAHNLRVAELRTNVAIGAIPDTGSRRTRTATFRLRPGVYSFRCTLFGHASLGMTARLRVIR